MNSVGYNIDLSTYHAPYEMRINDIPFRSESADSIHTYSQPAHLYLVDGTNEIELAIPPGPSPSQWRTRPERSVPEFAHLRAKLVRYSVGDTIFSGGLALVSLSWSANERLQGDSLRRQFELFPGFGRWAWQDAPKLVLDSHTIGEAIELVRHVRSAFVRRDASAIAQVASLVYNDIARAYPSITRSQLQFDFADMIERRSVVEQWEMAPLVESTLDFRLCGHDRMLDCIDRFWRPLIFARNSASNRVFSYPIKLARIGGALRIVRL